MKPSNVKKAILVALLCSQPLMLYGSPGVGKSNIVLDVAKSEKLQLIDIRASQFDPVDLRGLPIIVGERTKWTIPDFLPTDGAGIIFLDELSNADISVQAALYQLMLDGKLGDYVLPPGWKIIAAGNRQSDRAAAHRMSSALIGRMTNITVDTDPDDWACWAAQNDIAPEVIAFIKFRPDLLHLFKPDDITGAYASPRGWEFVSDLIKAGLDPEIEFDMIAGTVGAFAAPEFISYLSTWRTLPSIDGIISSPDSAKVPVETSTIIAVAVALARRATQDNLDNVMKYLSRLKDEYMTYALKLATDRDADLANTKSYIYWAAQTGGATV